MSHAFVWAYGEGIKRGDVCRCSYVKTVGLSRRTFPAVARATVGCASALIALGAATAYTVADFAATGASGALNQWSVDDAQPTQAAWESARRLLTLAATLKPYDAVLEVDRGRLFEWKAVAASSLVERRAARHIAIGHFTQAVEKVRLYGEAWAFLARSLVLNGQAKEGVDAWRNAARLSPFEPQVLPKIVEIGAYLWPLLGDHDRGLFIDVVRAALRYDDSGNILKSMVKYGREELIRPLLSRPGQAYWLDVYIRQRNQAAR